MQELSARAVQIHDDFWSPRLAINAERAIFHQWEQLESTRCIDNFRIAAGEKEGFREGYFFADSDAYKWLDAASRIYALEPDPKLAALMDAFIALLGRAQMDDGYLFTYNQIHFPGQRWVNLQEEHELYCHGHLIEAGVSHYEATGRQDLLRICIKAADLLVKDFLNASVDKVCGHEEVEIALIRLYRVTQREEHLALARGFLERRGRIPYFFSHWFRQLSSYRKRRAHVMELRQRYLSDHPDYASFRFPGGNYSKRPADSRRRWYLNASRGFYAQQHVPIRELTEPVGHSVRFGYLETAIAMLGREQPDGTLLSAMEQAWERMVTRRMYITGGLGSAPEIEGFAEDFDLDPEYAYAETCASIASLLWSWEMSLLTRKAKYADLFEWQLYNATAVGMGQNGDTYLYNNPLAVHQGVRRQGWYACACCPSNLSRTFADLGKYIYSLEGTDVWVHQYFGSETVVDVGAPVKIRIESDLPWHGKVVIHIDPPQKQRFKLHLRFPSWDPAAMVVLQNQQMNSSPEEHFPHTVSSDSRSFQNIEHVTASGYDPRVSCFLSANRTWSSGDTLEINFDMSIRLRRAHPEVKGHAGRVAITRGPLVYCLESIDHSDLDIFDIQLDPASLRDEYSPDLFGGCVVIHGQTIDGKRLKFIPYFLWGNRGASQMTVWVNAAQGI